jgi:hypothetical protein
MDSDALVEEQIEVGRKVVGLLKLKGIDVTAAAWVKAGERGTWSLYIASEDVDKNGRMAASLEIRGALQSMPEANVPLLELRVIGASDPLARDIQKILGEPAPSIPVRYPGSFLGGIAVDGVYIYPPFEPRRLAFTVAYARFGDTNHWLARTERGELLQGTQARGAMGYLTARWRCDQEGIERFATVPVLLEVGPQFDDRRSLDDPNIRREMRRQAATVADEMFRSHHPDAEIEHDEDEERRADGIGEARKPAEAARVEV